MLLRIAIVDDLPQDAERLQQALTAEGQTNIIRYESGDALLSAISPEQLDALFLDICMEGTNGIDTARKLREQAPTLPIVFVTSSKEYVWQSFPVHPFDYLLKPFEQARIRQLLDDLLRILQQPRTGNRGAFRPQTHAPAVQQGVLRAGAEPLRPHHERRGRMPRNGNLRAGGKGALRRSAVFGLQPRHHHQHERCSAVRE